ncbi:MAG: MOSC N-terminal beta barrel domain-containing protein [Burkholderiaceae bacterium]
MSRDPGLAGDADVRLAGLRVHPVKSCGGLEVDAATLVETGLEFDRAWMIVDAQGRFVSQRRLPRMALVQPAFRHSELVLRAPGMLALHLSLDTVEAACRVTVWDDEVDAYDMGALCAQWFSDFLGAPPTGRPEADAPPRGAVAAGVSGVHFPLRLARFDPGQRRLSDPAWTGEFEAENAFSDAFPLLVAGTASLDEVNRRLAARGDAPVAMARFRPNLVLEGLDPHAEDHLDEILFETPTGPVRIRLVKPCGRCSIPDVDPATGVQGGAVGAVLADYRADPRIDGQLSFGMNAVVVEGVDCVLRRGMTGRATYAFGA